MPFPPRSMDPGRVRLDESFPVSTKSTPSTPSTGFPSNDVDVDVDVGLKSGGFDSVSDIVSVGVSLTVAGVITKAPPSRHGNGGTPPKIRVPFPFSTKSRGLGARSPGLLRDQGRLSQLFEYLLGRVVQYIPSRELRAL